MASRENSPFKYLPYVTLREGWSQLKVAFVAWIIVSAIGMAFVAFADFGVEKTESYWSVLPKQVWYVIGFAAFTWRFRGEELRLVFPSSFKGWLLLNFMVIAFMLAALTLPQWVFVPFYFGVFFLLGTLDELAAIGKAAYERLSAQGSDSA